MNDDSGGERTKSAHVVYERKGPVAILRLNRPEKLNALTLEMHRAIFAGLSEFRHDAESRVLLITGTGRAFCAGDDMGESDPRHGVIPPETETEIAWHNMIRDMRSIPKPIIACVNGLACGAGGGLALGADMRFASDTASFADIFIRRGIAGGAYLLTQAVGTAKALELMFTGDFIDAQEAHRLGVFNRVFAADRLMDEAMEFAHRLANGPAQALGHTKLAAYGVAQLPLNEGLRVEELAKLYCLRGREVQEGIASFNDKRNSSFANERG